MTTQDHNVLCWIFCNLGTCYNSVIWPRKPMQSLKTQRQISFYIARLHLVCSSKTHDSLMKCVSCSKSNWYPICGKCLNINWWYSFYSNVQPAELTNYRAISKSEIFRSWSVFPNMVMLYNSPQAVSDLDRGWTVGPKEAHSKLADLKQKGAKQEVRQFLYWCLTFSPQEWLISNFSSPYHPWITD